MEPSFCGTADRRILPVLIFWYCLHFCCCYDLNLRQCEQGWVQVPETSQSGADVLTCTGVPSSQTVHWQFKSATGSRIVPFGKCPPLPGTCTSSLNTFTVSRPSTNVSHLTLSGIVSRSLAGATLYCYSGSTTANRVGCQADVVYPAEGVTCNFQLNVPTTVSGRCDIAKIYSSQNRYNCTWLESDGQNSAKVVPSKYVEWSTFQLSTNLIVDSAVCSLQGIPMPVKGYGYTVKVSPGSISVNATFNGWIVDHTEPNSDGSLSTGWKIVIGVVPGCMGVIAAVYFWRKRKNFRGRCCPYEQFPKEDGNNFDNEQNPTLNSMSLSAVSRESDASSADNDRDEKASGRVATGPDVTAGQVTTTLNSTQAPTDDLKGSVLQPAGGGHPPRH